MIHDDVAILSVTGTAATVLYQSVNVLCGIINKCNNNNINVSMKHRILITILVIQQMGHTLCFILLHFILYLYIQKRILSYYKFYLEQYIFLMSQFLFVVIYLPSLACLVDCLLLLVFLLVNFTKKKKDRNSLFDEANTLTKIWRKVIREPI